MQAVPVLFPNGESWHKIVHAMASGRRIPHRIETAIRRQLRKLGYRAPK